MCFFRISFDIYFDLTKFIRAVFEISMLESYVEYLPNVRRINTNKQNQCCIMSLCNSAPFPYATTQECLLLHSKPQNTTSTQPEKCEKSFSKSDMCFMPQFFEYFGFLPMF